MFNWGGRSATWSASTYQLIQCSGVQEINDATTVDNANCSANMSSNSRNVKLPFLTTRCHYWGVDLPLDLPIWAVTVEMWNCHSWPLDVTTGGSRSATWSANMSSHSRNAKLLFLTTRCHYWGVDLPIDLPIWALTVEMWNCHSWPLDVTTGGVDMSPWSANMSSKSQHLWNCRSLDHLRCQYQWKGGICQFRSANGRSTRG